MGLQPGAVLSFGGVPRRPGARCELAVRARTSLQFNSGGLVELACVCVCV